MMRVTCERCQARYEFDSSVLPADGYMAQCSHCEAQFFVAPPAAQAVHRRPPTPAPAPQRQGEGVTPPTQRSAPAPAAAGDGPLRDGAGTPDIAALLAAESVDAEHRHAAAQAARAGARRATLADLLGAGADEVADEQAQTLAQDQGEGGESSYFGPRPQRGGRHGGKTKDKAPRPAHPRTWSALTGRPERDTMDRPRSRARVGLVVGMICTALVTLGVVVGVARSERLHLPTQVPPPLRIVHEPPDAAKEAFAKGMAATMADNADSLTEARRAFASARALDEDYTDAWAGEALCSYLLAEDGREAAEAAQASLEALGGQIRALAAAQGSRAQVLPDPEPGADGEAEPATADAGAADPTGQQALEAASASLRLRALLGQQQQLQASLAAATRQVQSEQVRAASMLLHASQLPAQTPLLATTLALWFAGDETAQDLVSAQLQVAEALGMQQLSERPRRTWGEGGTDVPQPSPYAGWRMLVRAQLAARAQQSGRRTDAPAPAPAADTVVSAYEAALRLEPGLVRARWALARYLMAQGRNGEAAPHLRQLAEGDRPHRRALALWQDWHPEARSGGGPR